jgi:hypothetical protein
MLFVTGLAIQGDDRFDRSVKLFPSHPKIASSKFVPHLHCMASELSEYVGAFGQVVDALERHPVVTICLALLIITIGTPEIGPADKPWVRARSGVAWIAAKYVEARVEEVQIFKRLELRLESYDDKIDILGKRVEQQEKVVGWQTQVLMAIASAMRIDVLTLLGKQDSQVVPVARESVADVGGKKNEKNAEASAVPS